MKFLDILLRPFVWCFGDDNSQEDQVKVEEKAQEPPKWELTEEMVAEFASRPYIQAAVASPKKPSSVLSFYLGIDYPGIEAEQILKEGSYVDSMLLFWFAGHANFDKLCQSFAPVVHLAGEKSLQGENWDTFDGKVSQLILCDQLSRNCFRGTDEAFKYDDMSLNIAKDLAPLALSDNPDVYASYSFFIVVALLHSEDIEDHKLAMECIMKGKEKCPGINWELSKGALLQHTEVIERFGRYPHRNNKLGRQTTEEEMEWLQGDIPGWAKSQS